MAGIYIHIPFCQSRCIYCDFYSTSHHEAKEAYIKALVKELTLRAGYLQDEFSEPAEIKTIYLGGGTPSTLDASQLERIFSALYHTYRISSEAEITLEANPDDLTTEKIKELQSFPINRISIGIQTFNNRELHFLRRRHTAEQAIKAVKDCQNAGFSNISIDLIYGLPEQTISQWQSNITQALQLDVPHISAYALIYEGNTALDYAASSIHDQDMALLLLDAYVKDGKHQAEINHAMLQAALNPNSKILEYFANKGGKIDFAQQEIPLLVIAAGKNNMVENVRQMLKLGADVNMITPDKITPLHMAAASNPNPDMAKVLVEAGANVNAQDRSGLTPLMLTVLYNPNGDAVAEVLLEAKANPKLRDSTGRTYFEMLKERQVAQAREQTKVPENVGEATPIPED